MTYRTYDHIEPLDQSLEAARPRIDPHTERFAQGIGNAIIPGLAGWLMLGAMFYVAWGLLP